MKTTILTEIVLHEIPENVEFVTLTPAVAYAFDERNITYKTPEDYHYPQLIDPLIMGYISHEIPSAYLLPTFETIETRRYWNDFFYKYKNIEKPDRVIFYGNNPHIIKAGKKVFGGCFEYQENI